MSEYNVCRIPARDIPVPDFLSSAAKTQMQPPADAPMPWPELADAPGWRAHIAGIDASLRRQFEVIASSAAVDTSERFVDGLKIFETVPRSAPAADRGVILDMHGGGLVLCGGELCRLMGIVAAARLGVRVWSVDYRMPPDHPYPAALDDGLAAYRALLREREPNEIVFHGGSAGGNLIAALTLRARDEGLPLPAAIILATPEIDLTESGDSFHANLGLDPVLGSLMPANLLYANGHDLRHPYLSPLFGDFTKGFPPALLTTGTRDLYLSNTVRLHRALRAADIPAQLHVTEAAGHGGFFGAPEGDEIEREMRRFVRGALRK